jgi:putative nucleotidyltransferase with HDIG domain
MIDIQELKDYSGALNILYVEDDKELHEAVLRYLTKLFKSVESAYDGEEGLQKYCEGKFDIVLSDIKMPKLSGIEMIKEIKALNSEQEVIIISAHAETGYFMDAIHLNVSEYIIKPIDYAQMKKVLFKVARRLHAFKENLRYHTELEKLVSEKTKSLTDNYEQTLRAMVEMIEVRDSYTGGHSERVARYSRAIAQEMGLSQEECSLIYRAGMLHDIGKVTTPDSILLKPGKLSEREFLLIKDHVTVSHHLLSQIPMYKTISEIVLHHHEHYDGAGYPQGLSGKDIPLLSQIMIIADAFDAMTTNRIYKGRKSLEEAIEEMQLCSGKQFDPAVVPFACRALGRMDISHDISQLPKSTMEKERFSYFFRDSLTDMYNKDYLDFFLQQGIAGSRYKACACFLKNFSQYNSKHGWDKGSELLKRFAQFLQTRYSEAMVFRVQGDDFILLFDEERAGKIKEYEQPSFLDNTEVDSSCHYLSTLDDLMDQLKCLEGSE